MLYAVFAEVDPVRVRAACQAACKVISGLSEDSGRIMEGTEADAPAYLDFPEAHRRMRTNNVQGRHDREIERRTRAARSFPSEVALIRFVGAMLCDADDWSSRRCIVPASVADLWEPSRRT